MKKEDIEKLKNEFLLFSNEISLKLSEAARKTWSSFVDKILRNINLFDNDTLFIIATGMLKAGKSTLVNLLTRCSLSSPIGYGRDTTLRPVLIKMGNPSEKGKIKIFYSKNFNSTDEDKGKELRDILDYLRGASRKEFIGFEEIELNDEKLTSVLCDPADSNNVLDGEPLLVVIEVPYNQDAKIFFENGNKIMIFDMPGLDSANARCAQKADEYKGLIKECDMALFIQSSIAPININGKEYLELIGKERSNRTYRLIQNEMRSMYWRKNEICEKELQEQSLYGRNQFTEIAKIPKDKLKSDTVNLGMAYDSVFCKDKIDSEKYPADILLEKSKYINLENKISEDIKKNKAEILNIYSCDRLRGSVDECINGIKSEIEKNRLQIGQLIAENEKIKEKIKKISEVINSTLDLNNERSYKISNRLESALKNALEDGFNKVKQETGFKFKKMWNREIVHFQNEIRKKSERIMTEILNNSFVEDFKISNDESFLDRLNNKISNSNSILADDEIKIKKIAPDKIQLNPYGVKPVDFEIRLHPFPIVKLEKKFFFTKVDYDFHKDSKILAGIRDHYISLLNDSFIWSHITEIVQDLFTKYLEKELKFAEEVFNQKSADREIMEKTLLSDNKVLDEARDSMKSLISRFMPAYK